MRNKRCEFAGHVFAKQTEYRPRNFNLRNLQLRECMYVGVPTHTCVYACVYTYVCVSGRHKRTGRCAVSSAFAWSARKEFGRAVSTPRPPGDAADQSVGVACMHIHVYTYVYIGMYSATYEVCWCNFRLASDGVVRQKKRFPSAGKKRRCDRSELVVTNVPRQNSRPQILPVKRRHFLPE